MDELGLYYTLVKMGLVGEDGLRYNCIFGHLHPPGPQNGGGRVCLDTILQKSSLPSFNFFFDQPWKISPLAWERWVAGGNSGVQVVSSHRLPLGKKSLGGFGDVSLGTGQAAPTL